MKKWNWEQDDWPNFQWDQALLLPLEAQFFHQSGVLIGAAQHIDNSEQTVLVIDLMADEAIKTSEIEGEYLNRDSVQSSIRRNFGLDANHRRVKPAESGVAEMMVDLYRNFADSLSHETLYSWHRMIMNGRNDLKDIGRYRTGDDSMQVVSGPIYKPKIHFEAPPSKKVKLEMNGFIKWFSQSGPSGRKPLSALTRAGIAHLYFICIHPFEDGNGRIARAVAEKSLSQWLNYPTLIALSHTIQSKRSDYYNTLARNNKGNEISDWLVYFAKIVLEAQTYAYRMIVFVIEKTKLYERLKHQLNNRQEKVIQRMFREGLDGFKGGLSAENYISITGASRATATRDLQSLVNIEALIKTGELKSTRYQLNVSAFRE